MTLTDISAVLTALPGALAANNFRLTAAPGGGDSGDLAWVDYVEDEPTDTAVQPGGAGPGAARQIAATRLRVESVFDAASIDAARDRQADLLSSTRTALATTRRHRLVAASLGPSRGATPRYSAAVTVEINAR